MKAGSKMLACLVFVGLAFVAASPASADTYRFEDDFSLAVNSDASVWSYRFQSNGAPNNLARDGDYELLPNAVSDLDGLTGLSGWRFINNPVFAGLPQVARNFSSSEVFNGVSLRVPPGQCLLHPSVAQLVVVTWRAPRAGVVRVDFRFTDLDVSPNPADNGVLWYVDKGGSAGNLAGDVLVSGGDSGVQTLPQVSVAAGDRLHFVVDPNGSAIENLYYDSTRLWAEITYRADYDLERDFSLASNSETSTWSYRCQANGNPVWPGLPEVAVNQSGADIANGGLLIPVGQSQVHPARAQIVVVSWLAPSNRIVWLQFRFSDLNRGDQNDNGVLWFVDKGDASGNLASGGFGGGGDSGVQTMPYVTVRACDRNLASGSLENGGESGPLTLPYVNVRAGDRLNFIVDPNGSIGWDSTRLMAHIAYGEPLRLFIARQDAGVKLWWTTSAPPAIALQAAPSLAGP